MLVPMRDEWCEPHHKDMDVREQDRVHNHLAGVWVQPARKPQEASVSNKGFPKLNNKTKISWKNQLLNCIYEMSQSGKNNTSMMLNFPKKYQKQKNGEEKKKTEHA